jgi:ABC-type nitrate/sulfonate/bicarbonate transport system permease component
MKILVFFGEFVTVALIGIVIGIVIGIAIGIVIGIDLIHYSKQIYKVIFQ